MPNSHNNTTTTNTKPGYGYVPPGVSLPEEGDDTVLILGRPGCPEFRQRLEREARIRIDTAPYLREAILTFSTKYGVYPPAYAMMTNVERLQEFDQLQLRLREEFPETNCIDLLTPHHDRIVELLAEGKKPGAIARIIYCDRDNLRAYLAKHGL